MKSCISIMVLAVLTMTIIVSCKKDRAPKDYTPSIKNKTWWGQFTNAGETAQYYSVYFNGDGNFLWTTRNGDATGKWVINSNQLTMNFLMPAVLQIKADISDDNMLKNIVTDNTAIVNNGKMIINPTILLDNTVWKGEFSLSGGIQRPFQLDFMNGSKVVATEGVTKFGPYTYTRSASGAVINFDLGAYPFFAIISSDN
ncbi:MAG: hypothetical protein ABIR18_12160, partial [Chitinophagaceae bacterium]